MEIIRFIQVLTDRNLGLVSVFRETGKISRGARLTKMSRVIDGRSQWDIGRDE